MECNIMMHDSPNTTFTLPSCYRKFRWHKTSLPINATSRSLHDLIIRVFVVRVPAEKCMLIHCPKWHSRIKLRPVSNGKQWAAASFSKSEYGFSLQYWGLPGKARNPSRSKRSVVGVKAPNTPTTLKEYPSKL